MKPVHTCLTLLIAASLVGCAAPKTTEERLATAGPYPANWESIVQQYIKRSYFDPYSVRDSEAAYPLISNIESAWVICFRNNAKNRMGGYVGIKTQAMYLQHGRISSIEDVYTSECRNARFRPFPLE